MNIDEDTSAWLGCPSPLEMYKHQCSLLEEELTEAYALLRKARKNIAGLVQFSDELANAKAVAEAELKKALGTIAQNNFENFELAEKFRSLELIASQRDHVLRENQRLLLEITVLRGPQP